MFSMAPGLARDIANRPDLLESLLDGGFTDNIEEDTCGHFAAISNVPFTPDIDFEGAMNEVRRNFRDAHFRIRFKLLNDIRTLNLAGKCFSSLADTCIGALEPVALREVERTMGKAPGRWAVCGLGKLGSEDLTANSDLDLLVIFEPDGEQSASQFFARATQRLITALSAQTEEGLLYEADMQLRPSGRAGPVAVRYSAYADYYRKDAWTWERMAMTRLRPIAGNAALCRQIMDEKDAMLAMNRSASMICQDAWDMRQRLITERPGRHDFDVKLAKGGMMDIEFMAQVVQLLRHDIDWGDRKLDEVIPLARAASFFTEDEATILLTAYHYFRGILTYQRAALDKSRKSEEWPDRLKQLTSRALGHESFDDLKTKIAELEEQVWTVFCGKLQPETTEWGR
jgi:glutamate-ammonia-ligase adenylyltransferase